MEKTRAKFVFFSKKNEKNLNKKYFLAREKLTKFTSFTFIAWEWRNKWIWRVCMSIYVGKAFWSFFTRTWLHKKSLLRRGKTVVWRAGNWYVRTSSRKKKNASFSRSKVGSFACLPDGETNFSFTCYNLSYRSMSSLNYHRPLIIDNHERDNGKLNLTLLRI